MIYQLTVYGFDSGLNELLAGRMYDFRTKKYRNPIKNKNDAICQKAIHEQLKGVEIDYPVEIGYHFFCKNKMRDRMNVGSAFIKSFEDALQKENVLSNDGWDDVLTPKLEFDIDKENPRIEIFIVVRDDMKVRRKK